MQGGMSGESNIDSNGIMVILCPLPTLAMPPLDPLRLDPAKELAQVQAEPLETMVWQSR